MGAVRGGKGVRDTEVWRQLAVNLVWPGTGGLVASPWSAVINLQLFRDYAPNEMI